MSVRHVSDHRMVAVIELVWPGNKAGTSAFEQFVNKVCGVLHEGIHLLVIDPFPPTPRDPDGIPGAIWQEMTGKPFPLPAGKPLTAAAYCSGDAHSALVDALAVGEPLPDKPLFLSEERYVSVPLEATYQAAWQTFPAELRDVVSGEA